MPFYNAPPSRFASFGFYARMKRRPDLNAPRLDSIGLFVPDVPMEEALDVPSMPLLLVYATAALRVPPLTSTDWIEQCDLLDPAVTIFVPELGSPEHIADPLRAYQLILTARIRRYMMRWRCRLLCEVAFVATHMHKDPDGADQNPNTEQDSMAYNGRAKKNAGAWFRANELIRHNPTLKTVVNGDATIRTQGGNLLTIISEIATENGYNPSDDGLTVASKAVAMFPITKQLWMGYLPFSTYDETAVPPADEHRKDFATAATALRDRFYDIVRAWKLAKDAWNVDVPGNPGGEVSTETTTP